LPAEIKIPIMKAQFSATLFYPFQWPREGIGHPLPTLRSCLLLTIRAGSETALFFVYFNCKSTIPSCFDNVSSWRWRQPLLLPETKHLAFLINIHPFKW
jgi:hypothetical protein